MKGASVVATVVSSRLESCGHTAVSSKLLTLCQGATSRWRLLFFSLWRQRGVMHAKVAQSSESAKIRAHRLVFSHRRRRHEYGLSFLTHAITSSSPFLSMPVSFNTFNIDRTICIAQSLFSSERLLNHCSKFLVRKFCTMLSFVLSSS